MKDFPASQRGACKHYNRKKSSQRLLDNILVCHEEIAASRAQPDWAGRRHAQAVTEGAVTAQTKYEEE
ncbi:hypothetical protein [Collimonas humicola]|uniref:hypothetical protein n=1 Tax=Collimonas humicola TaxID=2825886 RepID=UPI001B8C1A8F|nr:hypothetical protein [Collimonas humicola]